MNNNGGYLRLNSEFDKKIDVFAYAMTMYEVVMQQSPWTGTEISDLPAIQNAVVLGQRPPFTQQVGSFDAVVMEEPVILRVIEAAWQQEPFLRPSFEQIIDKLLRGQ